MTIPVENALTEEAFAEFLADALALRGGRPFPALQDIKGAAKEGPFSRSELYRRAGSGEIQLVKVGSRTRIVTTSLLRAAARLPRVVPPRPAGGKMN